ncbi:membrane protein [Roseibium aquae]|uniref:Membrane protein n=1 Tax=Roseibium aquae TaxID=1323746 RepID=A0A916TAN8_9HYPH|nr:heparan-alpha-glucosaminide N-acetyltransferase [Roseibium aquae]GGB35398.1 membrane protein [Roseibium aquae]
MARTKRLVALDGARGIAIIAMVVYHFSWDLSWFGLVGWPVATGSGWRAFAGGIAASFLFLSGVTLVLAHGTGIRWKALARTKLVLLFAAVGVSLGTYFVFGDSFVRFGILHAIFLSGLLALPLLQAPWLISLAASAVMLTLPLWAGSYVFNGQAWLWTGLGTPDFGSVDYVPVAPWSGVLFLGVAVAQSPLWRRLRPRLAGISMETRAGRGLRMLGRRSLLIYLVHQPILFGLLYLPIWIGVLPDRATTQFKTSCTQSCQRTEGAALDCAAACQCTISGLKAAGTWEPLLDDPFDPGLRAAMNEQYGLCLADQTGSGPGR